MPVIRLMREWTASMGNMPAVSLGECSMMIREWVRGIRIRGSSHPFIYLSLVLFSFNIIDTRGEGRQETRHDQWQARITPLDITYVRRYSRVVIYIPRSRDRKHPLKAKKQWLLHG